MDNGRQVILWTAGAAGILLIYSAYKHESPLAEVKKWIGGGASATTPAAPVPSGQAATVPSAVTADQQAVQNQNEINNVLSGGGQGQSYVGSQDGVSYVYDANGNMVSEVPSMYQNSPGTYIPPKNVAGAYQ